MRAAANRRSTGLRSSTSDGADRCSALARKLPDARLDGHRRTADARGVCDLRSSLQWQLGVAIAVALFAMLSVG